jgi:hypothetical protein
MRDAGGHDVVAGIRIHVGSEDRSQHVRASRSFGRLVISCLVPLLDEPLQGFGLESFSPASQRCRRSLACWLWRPRYQTRSGSIG